MPIHFRQCGIAITVSALALMHTAIAQTNLPVYSDALASGFQDWSWGTHNLADSTFAHSGTYAASFSGSAWQALSFEHASFNPGSYTNLSFWLNGGGIGGQIIQIYIQAGDSNAPAYQLPALPANTNWHSFFLPFSALNVAGASNISRITFQLTSFGGTSPFYLADLNLAAQEPATVDLGINASQTVRPADSRWFGLNTAIWDSNFDTPATASALAEAGTTILRYPGGSASDEYHWATDKSLTNTWAWATAFGNYIHIATNIGAQAMITVNYGTGTSNEAAAWVKCANITNRLGFKYWEIGNECYGTWETDSNDLPHDPYTYAVRAKNYMAQMKAADPAIKIGVVSTPGEGSFSNNATHFAINPRTGSTNYGWTPVMLSTLKSLGVTPDFLIHHVYPEYGVDNDQMLLLSSGNWPGDAGDLRQQLSDYLGGAATNVELLCTENNSDAGNQGRQSTSLVNGLYLVDSLGQLMKTEFNGFVWWDLRNGTDTSGDFNGLLYGWRNYGDLGVINGLNTRHPVFYTFKLMQYFARAGDTVLDPTSDYAQLPVYAARKADGSLAVLVLNKDNASTFTAQLSLANYRPWTNALVRQYGIAQDEATRTNSVIPGAQDVRTNYIAVAGTNFNAAFPPYSVTLLTIPPAAPRLVTLPRTNGLFNLQVQGQANVRYVLQGCTNLISGGWTSVATNTFTNTVWLLSTNLISPAKFWRAVWLPLN